MNPIVPKVATPCTPLELARSLRDGHVMWCSSTPSDDRLACAWAHVAHEVGQGRLMTNHNHGHLTAGASWKGPVYFWDVVPEPIEPVPMYFRAYATRELGAADYWDFLTRGRHAGALALFDAGEPYQAALALAESGFYTAPAIPYAADMEKLFEQARRTVLPALHEFVDGDPDTAARLWDLSDRVRRGEGS